ncbi:MAG: IS481 family transposase [Alphaproteobacteria bacterium]|nr:IS481 family transposase [Alphaproteobacteria bacterium]
MATLKEEFVLRALEPDANLSALCREYGISRKTGYKWVARFKERGVEGLRDLSRRPHSSPLRTSGEVVLQVLELRRAHPRWGPKKLHAVLSRGLKDEEVPGRRTIARILERAGVVRTRKSRPSREGPTVPPEVVAEAPNDVWTVDFKGWWRTQDGTRAEPLTVRDGFSRYVLCAELMETTKAEVVRGVFQRLFERHGLPGTILVDNGSPFVSMRSPAGLTTLSAWWVSLGIRIVRSRPGCPQDNGGHERMHLDLRFDVEDAPADDLDAQRVALNKWRQEFNHVRPHEALDMKVPADIYRRSDRPFLGPKKPWYPPGAAVRRVNKKGCVKYAGRSLYVSMALAGHSIAFLHNDAGDTEMFFYNLSLGQLAEAA